MILAFGTPGIPKVGDPKPGGGVWENGDTYCDDDGNCYVVQPGLADQTPDSPPTTGSQTPSYITSTGQQVQDIIPYVLTAIIGIILAVMLFRTTTQLVSKMALRNS